MKQFKREKAFLLCLIIIMLLGFAIPGQSLAADPLDNWYWRNPLPSGTTIAGVAYGSGSFVAGCENGIILNSADAINWSLRARVYHGIHDLLYAGGRFIAFGAEISTSTDGITWTNRPSGNHPPLNSMAYGNGRFVGVGDDGTNVISMDGIT